MRRIRAVLAAALVWVPTASHATVWFGFTRETVACPGTGVSRYQDDFTLDMEPGTGTGILTFAGAPQLTANTDWTVDGKWGYFSASFPLPDGSPFILYGWMRGRKMRGYVVSHDYTSGCVLMGKLKGWY
jgi:hypothetical protein